jgi:integrase
MVKRKRLPGEGSVYFDQARGLWVAARTVGYTPAGNARRVVGRGRTQIAARQALERKLLELGGLVGVGGLEVGAAKLTVAAWLVRWLEYKAEVERRRPKTVERYRQVVKCHIGPALGARRLATLRPSDVEELLVGMASAGLSARSVRYAWSTLNNALRHAERRGLVAINVAARVQPPAAESKRPEALEPAEVVRLLEAARERSRYWSLFHIAITTGMRRGELVGLEWSDVDLVAGLVRVRRSQDELGRVSDVKTEASRREIPLSATDVRVLELHRAELADHVELAEAAGQWRGSSRVWPSSAGTPAGARNVYRAFGQVLEAAGLRRVSFHALRHTAATLALRAGVPVHVVSRRLGHKDAAITMRVYAHVLADMSQAGALELEELLAPVLVSVEAPAELEAGQAVDQVDGDQAEPVN